MQGKINFNAGPATLPPEVLHDAAKAIRKYKNTGLSILELPHRGPEFLEIIEESKHLVKKISGLNDDYEVLWLQGGGRMQFCMIPMNFLYDERSAGYIDSGYWSADAAAYATHYGDVQILATSMQSKYDRLPEWPAIPKQLSYVHFTTNNTISGTQWPEIPNTDVPLVADMSSDIFSRKLDYSKYAMFYAAAQKNIGVAGVALAVIRKDFLAQATDKLPGMLSFKAQAKENSILNTANVFGVYVSLLMLRWIDEHGIENIEKENARKAQLLYKVLDESKVFTPHVKVPEHRSSMNVCFSANSPENEKAFLDLCARHDIVGVAGHRSVGGFRASLYNAVTYQAVQELVHVIKTFENKQ